MRGLLGRNTQVPYMSAQHRILCRQAASIAVAEDTILPAIRADGLVLLHSKTPSTVAETTRQAAGFATACSTAVPRTGQIVDRRMKMIPDASGTSCSSHSMRRKRAALPTANSGTSCGACRVIATARKCRSSH